MKKFRLHCDQCNETQWVTATQAGSAIPCSCGSDVRVPPLSELRKSAGLDAYEMPTSERILQLVFDDKLPTHPSCVRCGDHRVEKQHLVAVCERSHEQSVSGGSVAGVIGGIPFYFPFPDTPTGPIVGRDVVVPLVFNICSPCWIRSLGRGWLPQFFAFSATILMVFAVGSLGIWLFFPDLVPSHMLLISAGICFLGAVAAYAAMLSTSTSALSKLRKGLCAEPIYRELFKQYPDTELYELQPREKA